MKYLKTNSELKLQLKHFLTATHIWKLSLFLWCIHNFQNLQNYKPNIYILSYINREISYFLLNVSNIVNEIFFIIIFYFGKINISFQQTNLGSSQHSISQG